MMPMNNEEIAQSLLDVRHAISSAVWVIVRDAGAAEDIFQDVVVKALSGSAKFEHSAELRSWAMIAARWGALDFARRHKKHFLQLDADVLELLERDALSCSSNFRLEALRACFETLPDSSRRILENRYFKEQPCSELAKSMNLTLDAVYQRLSRLHNALKSCIDGRLAADAALRNSEGAR